MKLLTAVIVADRAYPVTAALDSAGLMATTVTSTEAPGLKGLSRWHRGSEYRDNRCVRLEVLVSDLDAEIAFGILAPSGGPASDDMIVWCSEVSDLATPRSRSSVSDAAEMSGV